MFGDGVGTMPSGVLTAWFVPPGNKTPYGFIRPDFPADGQDTYVSVDGLTRIDGEESLKVGERCEYTLITDPGGRLVAVGVYRTEKHPSQCNLSPCAFQPAWNDCFPSPKRRRVQPATAHHITIAVTGGNLNDKEVEDAILKDTNLGRRVTMLDLHKNRLTHTFAATLSRWIGPSGYSLNLCRESLCVIKLHKNNLGNDGATALACICEVPTIKELHLSHNAIGNIGAEAIFKSCLKGLLVPRKELLTVRLDANHILDPLNLLMQSIGEGRYCIFSERLPSVEGKLLHFPWIWRQFTFGL